MDEIQRLKNKQKYGTEVVLIVPRFLASHIPDQFSCIDSEDTIADKGRFILRYDAEANPAVLLLMTCTVIRNNIDGRFLTYVKKATDPQIENKWSLLIGGYIKNKNWLGTDDIAKDSLSYHLIDRLTVVGMKKHRLIGYCQDKTGPTANHLGLIYETYVNSAGLRNVSTSDWVDNWVTLQQLADMYGAYNEWSKYLIDHYYKQEKEKMNA